MFESALHCSLSSRHPGASIIVRNECLFDEAVLQTRFLKHAANGFSPSKLRGLDNLSFVRLSPKDLLAAELDAKCCLGNILGKVRMCILVGAVVTICHFLVLMMHEQLPIVTAIMHTRN